MNFPLEFEKIPGTNLAVALDETGKNIYIHCRENPENDVPARGLIATLPSEHAGDVWKLRTTNPPRFISLCQRSVAILQAFNDGLALCMKDAASRPEAADGCLGRFQDGVEWAAHSATIYALESGIITYEELSDSPEHAGSQLQRLKSGIQA